MVGPVNIKNYLIGKGFPIFFIAEMACSHQGIVKNALELVKVAIKAKTDAIQIQVFNKESYMSQICKDYPLISRLELTQEEWTRVIKLIKNENVLLFAAGYDIDSIEFLISKGVDAFKIA